MSENKEILDVLRQNRGRYINSLFSHPCESQHQVADCAVCWSKVFFSQEGIPHLEPVHSSAARLRCQIGQLLPYPIVHESVYLSCSHNGGPMLQLNIEIVWPKGMGVRCR